jgi:hypothetical protein
MRDVLAEAEAAIQLDPKWLKGHYYRCAPAAAAAAAAIRYDDSCSPVCICDCGISARLSNLASAGLHHCSALAAHTAAKAYCAVHGAGCLNCNIHVLQTFACRGLALERLGRFSEAVQSLKTALQLELSQPVATALHR